MALMVNGGERFTERLLRLPARAEPFLMFQLLSTAGGVPVVVPSERC